MTPKWRCRILWESLLTLHVINRRFLFPLGLVDNHEYDYNDTYQLLKGGMGLGKTTNNTNTDLSQQIKIPMLSLLLNGIG